MSSLESSLKFEPRVSRNGGGGLATIVPSDDPFSTLWAMVIRLLENCPSEFIPGSSKKTAIRHNVTSYAPSPPYPLTSMLQLCGLELPTKMAVFFWRPTTATLDYNFEVGGSGEKFGIIASKCSMAVFFEEPGLNCDSMRQMFWHWALTEFAMRSGI